MGILLLAVTVGSVRYFRHPLLLAQLTIFIALASLLTGLALHHATAVTPLPTKMNMSQVVATLRLDSADLGPAAIYGGQSWTNVVSKLRTDAQVDVTHTSAPYKQQFAHVASLAKLALTDKTQTDRVADEVSITTALDRLTLVAGGVATA